MKKYRYWPKYGCSMASRAVRRSWWLYRRSLSRKSMASGLTRCWFSLWMNRSQRLRECLQHRFNTARTGTQTVDYKTIKQSSLGTRRNWTKVGGTVWIITSGTSEGQQKDNSQDERTTLAQIRTGHCVLLKAYRKRIVLEDDGLNMWNMQKRRR